MHFKCGAEALQLLISIINMADTADADHLQGHSLGVSCIEHHYKSSLQTSHKVHCITIKAACKIRTKCIAHYWHCCCSTRPGI